MPNVTARIYPVSSWQKPNCLFCPQPATHEARSSGGRWNSLIRWPLEFVNPVLRLLGVSSRSDPDRHAFGCSRSEGRATKHVWLTIILYGAAAACVRIVPAAPVVKETTPVTKPYVADSPATIVEFPNPSAYPPQVPGYCFEFDHPTRRNGLKQVCRMLWCGNYTGGLATLWCERDFDEPKGTQEKQ